MRAIMFAVLLLLPATAGAQNIVNNPRSWVQQGDGPRVQAATTSSASSGGASVNLRDRLQAPALGSFAAASGPCTGASTSGGFTLPGFGAQGGRTEIEAECQVREAARLLAAMGDTEGALRLIRSLPSVRAVLAEPPATVAAAPIATPPAAAALVAPAPARPAWCDTASPADGARVAAACAR
jgi:hypothetical protein